MVYQRNAPEWKRDSPQHLSDFVARPVVLDILKRLENRDEVLDAGGGEGYFSRKIANLCGNVTNVELSGPMVEQAVNQDNMRNVQGDVRQLPVQNESIDVYVSNFVASNLVPTDIIKMYGEISRVLKPDGWFIMSIPHPQNFFALQKHAPAIIHEDAVRTDFNYIDSQGKRFHTTLGKVDGGVVHVAHVHNMLEDYLVSIEYSGLQVTYMNAPPVSERVTSVHSMFASLEGEKPYLVFAGRKSLPR